MYKIEFRIYDKNKKVIKTLNEEVERVDDLNYQLNCFKFMEHEAVDSVSWYINGEYRNGVYNG